MSGPGTSSGVAAPAHPIPFVARQERRLVSGIIAISLLLLVLATAAISQAALRGFEREVVPELGREVSAVGANLAAQIERAVALGIPPDQLVGVDSFLGGALVNRPALDSVRLDMPGRSFEVHQPGPRQAAMEDIAIPVVGSAGPIGTLHLGVNAAVLARSAADSRWDIAVVLGVSLLFTAEVLLFLTDRAIGGPMQTVERLAARMIRGDWTTRAPAGGTDAIGRFLSALGSAVRRVNERRQAVLWLAGEVAREAPAARDAAGRTVAALKESTRFAGGRLRIEPLLRSPVIARTPLFLYLMAEQLSTSFIPIFAKSVSTPGGWVPQALAVGLPITVFAGVIGVMSPFGARLAGRRGARWVFALGCIPAALGYLLTATSGSVVEFTLWRALTGVGYALVTIAAQAYLVSASEGAARGRSMAVFVTAAMTGAVCGTAIGAVLADRLGYRATFCISAALTLAAGLLAVRTMDATAGRRPPLDQSGGRSGGHVRDALSTPPFLALAVLAAMPAKLVLSGFVFYIAPLFLLELGDTQPEIGRQVMLYSGAMLLTIRFGAWTADRMGRPSGSIALAGVLTGVALLAPLALPLTLALPLAIAVVGLCQGLASAPMLAVVPDLCPDLVRRLGVATLYGYLRMAERIGSIVGPVLAAALVGGAGFVPATAAIGTVSLLASVGYWAVAARAARA